MKNKKVSMMAITAIAMSLMTVATSASEGIMTASAAQTKTIDMGNSCLVIPNPYENEFNVTACTNYAIKWHDKRNSNYTVNKWAKANCASFVSESLSAGGIKISEAYRECDGVEIAEKLCLFGDYTYNNTEWSLASKQFTYLTTTMGYDYEEASDTNIHVGDAVYYDWNDKDKDINHAAICIAISDDRKPVIAEHTSDNVRVWDKTVHSVIEKAYVVHTTNTTGLMDVTSEYYDKSVRIKAMKKENSGFLNAGSSYFVSSYSQSFNVCKDKCFDYANLKDKYNLKLTYPVSLKSNNTDYLSAYVNQKDAPIKYTSNNDTWEAFRIYRVGDKEYIQSMQNGLFVHIQDDGKAYAHGKLPSTWETFDIK